MATYVYGATLTGRQRAETIECDQQQRRQRQQQAVAESKRRSQAVAAEQEQRKLFSAYAAAEALRLYLEHIGQDDGQTAAARLQAAADEAWHRGLD